MNKTARPKFGVLLAAAALGTLAQCAGGCGCGATPTHPAEAGPTQAASATSLPLAATAAGVAGTGNPTASLTARAPVLNAIPILTDPRLAVVRAALQRREPRAAATSMQAAIASHRPTGVEAAQWQFILGSSLQDDHDSIGAAAAFDSAAATPGFLLADYARIEAAVAYTAAGRHAEARDRLAAIPSDLPISERSRLLLADCLEALNEKAQALAIWRTHLAGDRPKSRWAEIAVRIAEQLMAGSPDAKTAREAFGLARRVAIHAPASPLNQRAAAVERQALAALPAEARGTLQPWTASEHMDRADELLSAGRASAALEEATTLWKRLKPQDKGGTLGCRASMMRAELLQRDKKKRDRAAEAYADAARSCAKEPTLLVKALYNGAKTNGQIGKAAEAVALFARVEKEFAGSRLADDARLRAARVVRNMQDEPRFLALLASLPTDYPDGDMVDDGLFELAFHHIRKGDWGSAIAPLERSLQLRPQERDFWTRGRARYFLGRAYEATGHKAEATQTLEAVVVAYPLAFYAVMAMAKLRASSSSERVQQLIAQGEARESEGALFEDVPAALRGPALERAAELLRVGEQSLAKKEIQSIAVRPDDDQASWALASLYARAGAIQESYRIARSLSERWGTHYPKGPWRAAWELAYPRPHLDVVQAESQRSNIPVSLAYGIMREESAFDPGIASAADAYGLMQLILPTARQAAKSRGLTVDREALFRPEINITLGCAELGGLWAMFPSAPVLAIPSYNAGAGATKRWLEARASNDFAIWVEAIPYEETRSYTRRVLQSKAAYAYLYEPNAMQGLVGVPLVLD